MLHFNFFNKEDRPSIQPIYGIYFQSGLTHNLRRVVRIMENGFTFYIVQFYDEGSQMWKQERFSRTFTELEKCLDYFTFLIERDFNKDYDVFVSSRTHRLIRIDETFVIESFNYDVESCDYIWQESFVEKKFNIRNALDTLFYVLP